MTKVLTTNDLFEFLKDMDGNNASVSPMAENIFIRLLDLEGSDEQDDKFINKLSNDIMLEYGHMANVEVVRQLTHEELVEMLGFDFVEVE